MALVTLILFVQWLYLAILKHKYKKEKKRTEHLIASIFEQERMEQMVRNSIDRMLRQRELEQTLRNVELLKNKLDNFKFFR